MNKTKRRHTEQTRIRMSAAHKGKTLSQTTRSKISKALSGRKLSKATRFKMSKAKKGMKRSESFKQYMRDFYALKKQMGLGRKMTPAQLKRHRAMLLKLKPWDNPNSKQALVQANLNRKVLAIGTPKPSKRPYRKRSIASQ